MASGGKRSAPPKPFDSKSAASSGGEAWKKISGPQMLAINSEHKIRSENLPFDIDGRWFLHAFELMWCMECNVLMC